MLQRLYIHNFLCLENFELTLKDRSSALLIGKNGTGKSAIAKALKIFQAIGQGNNRVSQLVDLQDFNQGRSQIPMRFEIEVLLEHKLYQYILALELPQNFKELRVAEEQLKVDETTIYIRKEAQVTFYKSLQNREAQFLIDWHLVALPIIQEQSTNDPLYIFKNWLHRTLILAPIPSLMTGESLGKTLQPKQDVSNIGDWLAGLLELYPAAYTQIDRYLREVMPDLQDFRNEKIGKNSTRMLVRFAQDNAILPVYFENLSDGEKCFFVCGIILAANTFSDSLFCFWDEPDNHLSLSEVGHFMASLRRSFHKSGQILVTSHNPEAIRKFSHENTFILDRKSHLEPTLIRSLSHLSFQGDLVDTLIRGDLEL